MRSAELLTKYLVELDRRGWDLEAFVREHPEMPEASRDMLRAAEQVRGSAAPVPTDVFRQRSRQRLAAAMARPPSRRRWYRVGSTLRPYRPLLAPVAAGLLIVFGLGGVWSASAAALPNSPLYSAKLVIEQAELVTALTPDRRAEVHLAIAQERLREASVEQQRGDFATAAQLIHGSDSEVALAQAAVLAATPPTSVATEVAGRVTRVRDERRQIATHIIARATVTQRPDATRAGESDNDGLPASPTMARPVNAMAPQPTRGKAIEGGRANVPADRRGGSGDSRAGHSDQDGNNTMAGIASTPVSRDTPTATASATSTWVPEPTPAPTATFTVSQEADALLRVLVTQALQGDPAAQQSAQQYVALLRSVQLNGPSAQAKVAEHRAVLTRAITAAPANTRPVLQAVLGELNRTAGEGVRGSHAPNPTPTRQPTESQDGSASARRQPSETPTRSATPKRQASATRTPSITPTIEPSRTPTARPTAFRTPTVEKAVRSSSSVAVRTTIAALIRARSHAATSTPTPTRGKR